MYTHTASGGLAVLAPGCGVGVTPCPLMIGGASVGMYGVGFTDGACVTPGAGVGFKPGLGVDWPGRYVGASVGNGLGFGLGACVTPGAGVGKFLQTGTRQHGSLGSVSSVHPAGTFWYWAHLWLHL